jgi:hypothetical protein
MAIEQQSGPGGETGRHAGSVPGIELDEDKTSPVGTIAFGFGLELAKEGLFEFQELKHTISGNEWVDGGGSFGKQDVFKLVRAGGDNGGALVDFRGIEQVEDGEMLNGKDFVHALEAETTLAIEEIGDVSLFESGLLSESKSSKFAAIDPFQEDFTEVVLQGLELH